MLDKPTSSVNT